MRAQGGGRIVNISSIYGLMTTPLTGWYQASKHALEALSDALRVELAADGIFVVLIEPGAFRSNIWDAASNDVQRKVDSEYFAAYRSPRGGNQGEPAIVGRPHRGRSLDRERHDSEKPEGALPHRLRRTRHRYLLKASADRGARSAGENHLRTLSRFR